MPPACRNSHKSYAVKCLRQAARRRDKKNPMSEPGNSCPPGTSTALRRRFRHRQRCARRADRAFQRQTRHRRRAEPGGIIRLFIIQYLVIYTTGRPERGPRLRSIRPNDAHYENSPRESFSNPYNARMQNRWNFRQRPCATHRTAIDWWILWARGCNMSRLFGNSMAVSAYVQNR